MNMQRKSLSVKLLIYKKGIPPIVGCISFLSFLGYSLFTYEDLLNLLLSILSAILGSILLWHITSIAFDLILMGVDFDTYIVNLRRKMDSDDTESRSTPILRESEIKKLVTSLVVDLNKKHGLNVFITEDEFIFNCEESESSPYWEVWVKVHNFDDASDLESKINSLECIFNNTLVPLLYVQVDELVDVEDGIETNLPGEFSLTFIENYIS